MPNGQLPRRGRETLLLLLGGKSEKEIAYSLHISINTVHTYVKGIIGAIRFAAGPNSWRSFSTGSFRSHDLAAAVEMDY